jgi:hypothetical protein
MNKSQNGWDASKVRAEIDIDSFSVPGTTIKLTCNKAVAPLLVKFAAEFHSLIEPIDEGSLDDWGYCYREIRGSSTALSNHSSGTAIDLNATKHPLGKAGTFPLQKVAMIQALARKYGLRWGGDYTGRKDEMHFEIALSQAKVAKLIGSLDKGEIK